MSYHIYLYNHTIYRSWTCMHVYTDTRLEALPKVGKYTVDVAAFEALSLSLSYGWRSSDMCVWYGMILLDSIVHLCIYSISIVEWHLLVVALYEFGCFLFDFIGLLCMSILAGGWEQMLMHGIHTYCVCCENKYNIRQCACIHGHAYIYMYIMYTLYIYVSFSNPPNCRHPRHHQSWKTNPYWCPSHVLGKMLAADDMMSSW